MFVEKEFPNSKGTHFIVPKISDPKYQISDRGFKIEVGPGQTYAVINKISLPFSSG